MKYDAVVTELKRIAANLLESAKASSEKAADLRRRADMATEDAGKHEASAAKYLDAARRLEQLT